MDLSNFLRETEKLIGRDNVIREGHELLVFRRDWWPLLMLREVLGRVPNPPPAIIRPRDIDDVINVVKLANKYGVCLVPYGGGSSVVGGAYHDGCVVIDMTKLNRILEFNEEDLTIIVEAGARVIDIEKWLNERGYTLDYHPQSFQLLTIGGAIAHGGTGSHSMSNINELVLALDVVLPNGELVTIGPGEFIRTSWPDLRGLFIGSDGVLGIIVRAMLKVKPLANYYVDLAYVFKGLEDAIHFARGLAINVPGPCRVVIHDRESSRFMVGEDGVIALVRVRWYNEELVNAVSNVINNLAIKHGAAHVEPGLVRKWRDAFARGYEAQLMMLAQSGLWVDTIDMATTWSKLIKLHTELVNRLGFIDGVYHVLSRITHLYLNGASLYSVVVFRQDEDVYWRVWREAFSVASNVGATISHHHGTGILKRDFVRAEMGRQYDLLRSIKELIDRNNIMNRGKLI
ncbi:FAD-binding oxidoreductase [Vulcanisaeta distributa]|uniref:FAD linked oxidase domain protein n=1 Tax=Vulcanisaeta distributa (strain DSM 14429 / JCM 11212 / NBRC 100878 / IC-017) TaxID=572478 RepID=E1QTQ8_VULDI|nr:FAD-binding oxidoreductase [Vulcanisaeta distributa]ADN50975.1 FAD linked oxidase domain protein [Vulcanisaeta distributa DSM 14429]